MISHNPAKLSGQCNPAKFNGFSLSLNLVRQRNQRVMWLYAKDPFKVSYHPTKFGDHSHLGTGDTFSVFHVILKLWRHQQLLD